MTQLRHRQQQEALDLSHQEVAASPNEIGGYPNTSDTSPWFHRKFRNQHSPQKPPQIKLNSLQSQRTWIPIVFYFDDMLFRPTGPSTPTLTQAQKRETCRRYRHTNGELCGQQSDISPKELRRLQEANKSLDRPQEITDGVPTTSSFAAMGYSIASTVLPAPTMETLTSINSSYMPHFDLPFCTTSLWRGTSEKRRRPIAFEIDFIGLGSSGILQNLRAVSKVIVTKGKESTPSTATNDG